jgi:hypothetical protein
LITRDLVYGVDFEAAKAQWGLEEAEGGQGKEEENLLEEVAGLNSVGEVAVVVVVSLVPASGH